MSSLCADDSLNSICSSGSSNSNKSSSSSSNNTSSSSSDCPQRRSSSDYHYKIAGIPYTDIFRVVSQAVITIIEDNQHLYNKVPYHTSIFTGLDWVNELINGHPECIHTELGVHLHVFNALIATLQKMGYSDLKYVMLKEQLAIFLYGSVTSLTIWHIGEWFQRSNDTISK